MTRSCFRTGALEKPIKVQAIPFPGMPLADPREEPPVSFLAVELRTPSVFPTLWAWGVSGFTRSVSVMDNSTSALMIR
jgi:hypothetical protein